MNNAQAVVERDEGAVTTHPATDMLAMIERLATNPAIDTDKLERLIAMKKDMDATVAKVAFNGALVRMQPELPSIAKRGESNNGQYGKWEDIQGEIQPVLARHGFALSFKTASTEKSITVTAILRHEAGHDDSTDLTLPADNSGSKNSVQAVGSSVSYGKRYTACALLNIRVGGEDNDGRTAIAGPVTEDQIKALRDAIADTRSDIAKFCKYFKIEALPDLPAKDFDRAMTMISGRRKP